MIIKEQLIPDNKKPKYNVEGKLVTFQMVPEYITIHETANTGKGANAQAHANLQLNGNSRQASWHVQVDDKEAIQSLPFNEAGMHAGDGTYGNGNRKSIGIEICVNCDGNYEKALENAAAVVGQLMERFNIPPHRVVTHKHWSGKNCPTNLLKGRWQEFLNRCIAERGKISSLSVGFKSKEAEQEMELEDARLKARPAADRIGVLKVLENTVLREGPSNDTNIIRHLEPGGEYKVSDYQDGWFKVGGWVHSEYVNFLPNVDAKISL